MALIGLAISSEIWSELNSFSKMRLFKELSITDSTHSKPFHRTTLKRIVQIFWRPDLSEFEVGLIRRSYVIFTEVKAHCLNPNCLVLKAVISLLRQFSSQGQPGCVYACGGVCACVLCVFLSERQGKKEGEYRVGFFLFFFYWVCVCLCEKTSN